MRLMFLDISRGSAGVATRLARAQTSIFLAWNWAESLCWARRWLSNHSTCPVCRYAFPDTQTHLVK